MLVIYCRHLDMDLPSSTLFALLGWIIYHLSITEIVQRNRTATDALLRFYYNTPFVLGTSLPPVLSMACRIARARALKADSAL